MKWLVACAFAILLGTMVTTTVGSRYFPERAAPSVRITIPALAPPGAATSEAPSASPPAPATSTTVTAPSTAAPSPTSPAGYTLSQVAEHSSSASCWLIIDHKVFDVTSYLDTHPGGAQTIAPWCGKESTDAFATEDGLGEHSPKASTLLIDYYIGEVTP